MRRKKSMRLIALMLLFTSVFLLTLNIVYLHEKLQFISPNVLQSRFVKISDSRDIDVYLDNELVNQETDYSYIESNKSNNSAGNDTADIRELYDRLMINEQQLRPNISLHDESTRLDVKLYLKQILGSLENASQITNAEELLKQFSKKYSRLLDNSILATDNKKAYRRIDKDKLGKVSIKFRLTNVYRIDLHCFWTYALKLNRKFVFTYNYQRAEICMDFKAEYKYPFYANVVINIETIQYMISQISKHGVRSFDEKFLSDFPTKQLINGGGWFPNFDFVKYNSEFGYKHIFQINTADYDCVPKERIAILVPMRGREDNLNNFLIHMHYFLQKQMKTYKIFVVEQINDDSVLFNKGRLYNTGFKYITEQEHEWEFNCVVLHDVDLLPLNLNLDYSCADMPRHMSIYVKRLSDYSLSPHYRFLTGGVLAVRPYHYKQINGYSNEYFGWGGEDDDLSIRLIEKELCVIRPSKNISVYVMQSHHASKQNLKRWELIMSATNRIDFDGLSNIHSVARIARVEEFNKYTRILVDVNSGN